MPGGLRHARHACARPLDVPRRAADPSRTGRPWPRRRGPPCPRPWLLPGRAGSPARRTPPEAASPASSSSSGHPSILQIGRLIAAMRPAAGIVVSQVIRFLRTTAQRTWCHRRRARPMPTIEEATIWLVLTGAPRSDATKITPAELPWLTSPSIVFTGKVRRPIVWTMPQPPSIVPRARATAEPRMIAGLPMNELVNRAATRSVAIRPANLAVSLGPWLAASQAEVTYCPARTGPAARTVVRANRRRAARSRREPATVAATGVTASATRIPIPPTGSPGRRPPQLTAPGPASSRAAPSRPPTRACDELDGIASRQVITVQATAPQAPAPMTGITAWPDRATTAPRVPATAVPNRNGPTRLNRAARTTAGPGLAARDATRVAVAVAAPVT